MTVGPAEGHIVTFYSYKGGTGRSMALANVAWILASQGKRVLVIDWDLEAPGLHRYFHPFLADKNLSSSEGLMEFVVEYVSHALAPPASDPQPADWYVEHADILRYAQSLRWPQFKSPGTIDLIPAGRQVSSYASTVNLFNWHQFYDKLGGERFFEAAKQAMRADYDYILIDSRTGVSDTSGICTVQMPETVVICFTLNIQSIEGASAVAETITLQRERLGIPVRIVPVPTRVDTSEKDKVDLARVEAWRRFEPYLTKMTQEEINEYWGSIEVPYKPWYSFEEVLATFGDRKGLRTSMLSAMETLTSYVSHGEVQSLAPITEAERLQTLNEFLRSPADEKAVTKRSAAERGEQAMDRLPAALRDKALSFILRMTHVAGPDVTRRQLPRKALDDVPDRVLSALRYGRLIVETRLPDGQDVVELADDEVIRGWTRVQQAIDQDRSFLTWRETLGAEAATWEATRQSRLLLRGERLAQAGQSLRARPADFNASEQTFVTTSEKRRRNVRMLAASVAIFLLTAAGFAGYKVQTDEYQVSRALEDAHVDQVDASPAGEEAVKAWITALVKIGQADQAHSIAAAAPTPEQRAMRFAALATSISDPAAVTRNIVLASKAIGDIEAPTTRARTEIDVANMLLALNRETAGRLVNEAVGLAEISAYDVVRERTAQNEPSGNPRAPASPRALTPPGIPAEYVQRQLVLLRDLLDLMSRLQITLHNERILRDADLVLARVNPADRADWLLAVADYLPAPEETAKSKEEVVDLRQIERRKAIEAISTITDDGLRRTKLLRAVSILMRTGDPENAELILDSIQPPAKFSPREIHDTLIRTMQALAHWGVEHQNDRIWLLASKLRPLLSWPQRYEALAEEAAARAAAAQVESLRDVQIAAKGLRDRSLRPADEATIMSALSHAYYRLEDRMPEKMAPTPTASAPHPNYALLRDHAAQTALLEPDPALRAAAVMNVAMAAARCGDLTAAVRVAQNVENSSAVEEQLTELILLMADAGGGLKDTAAAGAAKELVVLSASYGKMDEALLAALGPFEKGLKKNAAIEIVNAIASPTVRYQAFTTLSPRLKRAIKASELEAIAAKLTDSYLRSLALLIVAQHQRSFDAAGGAHKLVAEAAEDARKITEVNEKSRVLGDVAMQFASDGDLRAARQSAIECTVKSDRLRGFAAVVAASAVKSADRPGSDSKSASERTFNGTS
jgi:MinD-like ATPase involved in chromosome partitioning or flagellar assembly